MATRDSIFITTGIYTLSEKRSEVYNAGNERRLGFLPCARKALSVLMLILEGCYRKPYLEYESGV